MNKLTNNIPNKIKQPSKCCIYCGKSYIKSINLNKHLICCELFYLGKKKNNNKKQEEEQIVLPSQEKLFEMLVIMSNKYSKLEEKVEELTKQIATTTKKKNINIFEWLKTNKKPNCDFECFINKIHIDEDDVKLLFNNSFQDVFKEVFSRKIDNLTDIIDTTHTIDTIDIPIFACIQKQNTIYICEYRNNESKEKDIIWVELSKEKLVKMLNKIYMKIFTAFYEWKKRNSKEINSDINLTNICDKTLVKLTSVDLKNEILIGKLKKNIYTKIKIDTKIQDLE